MATTQQTSNGLVICIRNDGYPASLERRKLYQTVADPQAAGQGQVRVVDESGDDYLYPQEYFVAVQLPETIERAVIEAA